MTQSLVNVRKNPTMSNMTQFDDFNAMVDQLKSVGGKSVLWNKQLIEIANEGFLISINEKREDEQ